MIKTISSIDFKIQEDDTVIEYQESLTKKLDCFSNNFDQAVINEIVLWKVNRYAEMPNETLSLINSISNVVSTIDIELTQKVLRNLLCVSGVQLPMASTILRFKNPSLYQIIDQRVYRILTGEELKLKSYKSASNIDLQIELYLNYLTLLRVEAQRLNIPFNIADRVLYNVDKRINKDKALLRY